VYSLIGVAILAGVFLIVSLVALIPCDQSDIPEIVRALSPFTGHRQVPGQPARQRRRLGARTGAPSAPNTRDLRRYGP
jgi:hypothetical protein